METVTCRSCNWPIGEWLGDSLVLKNAGRRTEIEGARHVAINRECHRCGTRNQLSGMALIGSKIALVAVASR